jgi:hypothetical protein
MMLADVDPCIATLLTLLLLGLTIWGIGTSCDEIKKAKDKAAREAREEFSSRRREVDEQSRANTKWHDEFAVWKKKEEERIAKESDALEAKRADTEEQARRVARAIQAATAMAQDLPAANHHEAVSAKLRELHLKGFCYGNYLTVHFIGSLDGFIRLRWTVQLDRPQPPRVELRRDGEIIHTSSSFGDEHGDHVPPGNRPRYSFNLYDDRGRLLDKELIIEVPLPTPESWAFNVGELAYGFGTGADRDRKMREAFARQVGSLKLVRELTESAYEEIEEWDVGEEIKEWAKSQIDALATRLGAESVRA